VCCVLVMVQFSCFARLQAGHAMRSRLGPFSGVVIEG
jgi:hypothetical protein